MSEGRLSILLATAMPDDVATFHAGRKARTLRQKLSPLIEHGMVTLAVEPAARVDRLARLLRTHRPRILHIACHAIEATDGSDQRVLALEDYRGGRDEIDAEELHTLIEQASPHTDVVILEACTSGPIAEALFHLDEGRVVIGTKHKIQARVSTRFFLSFHQALAAGQKIEDAFTEARRDMELFAPSLWGIPVIFGTPERLGEEVVGRPSPTSFRVDPNSVEDFVHIAEALDPPDEVVGREDDLRWLDEHWFEDDSDGQSDRVTSNIVHLHGTAGFGKTAIVARWLELNASRSWCGATRVFSWSFDPLARGAGAGDVATFFRRALEFFGAMEPHFRSGAGEANQEGEWLQGLRLARVIRHERVLLCLDHLPTIPHPLRDEYEPHEVLSPGLAALLHELDKGHAGLCILTSRLEGGLRLGELDNRRVEGLDTKTTVELLVARGAVEKPIDLEELASGLEGDPLAVELAASVLSTGGRAKALSGECGGGPLHRLKRVGALDDERATRLLSALALRGGSLDASELRLLAGATPSEGRAPSWAGYGEEFLRVLRMLRSRGVITIASDHTVALAHSALLESIPIAVLDSDAFVIYSRRALSGAPREAHDIPAYIRAIRVALGTGRAEVAENLYVDKLCRQGTTRYERNYLTRNKGAMADSLRILAEFFVPDERRCFGMELRDEVKRIAGVEQGRFHCHAGLALRHLGLMSAAAERLEMAYEAYPRDHERAAICANDLSEVMIWRGRYEDAKVWAEHAVQRADKACQIDPKTTEGKLSRAAKFVSLATQGHVHVLLGRRDAAARIFEDAVKVVEALNEGNPDFHKHLYSRPGYYYWNFLLAEITELKEGHAELVPKIKALAEQLEGAKRWHGDPQTVARVSRALDALVRGRLILVCIDKGIECPDSLFEDESKAPSEAAYEALGFAIHVFRANQHLWMLPTAHRARAHACEALEDTPGAEIDKAEAEGLEQLFLLAEPSLAEARA